LTLSTFGTFANSLVTRAERDDDAAALQLVKRRFAQGYTSYLEVLDAERTLLAAELALVQTRADRFAAHVKLYQSVGGGWSRASTDG
jgi:outer membrane protein, multidrug efflux system